MTVAWPKNAVASMAPHALSEYGACTECAMPVHTTGIDSAVHTRTGLFSCTEADPLGRDGANLDPVAAEEQRQAEITKACEETATEVRENVGSDLQQWLDTLERKYTGDLGLAVLAEEIIDMVREWSEYL